MAKTEISLGHEKVLEVAKVEWFTDASTNRRRQRQLLNVDLSLHAVLFNIGWPLLHDMDIM